MRSRVESVGAGWRRGAEWMCRLGALGLLGWCLWASAVGRGPSAAATHAGALARGSSDTADGRPPTADVVQLAEWTRSANLDALHLALSSVPDARTRAWLRALDGAGTRVTWAGEIPAIGIAAEPVADPRGGVRVSVAAPAGAAVLVADEAGRIDSLTAVQGGGTVRAPTVVGSVHAASGNVVARTSPTSSRALREIVVLGRAGWEAKFIAAALEEQGWDVTVRMPVAPGIAVGPAVSTFDTARVSAVVALDSAAAAYAAALARFVRAGGGVILGSEAARLPAFAPLVAGRAGATLNTAASYAAAVAPVTRRTLAIAPVASLRADAVALERRDGHVLLAARRVEAGRVLQLGYEETWRWRMAGGDDAPDAHRQWWSELVASVAYAPPTGVGRRVSGEPQSGVGRWASGDDVEGDPAPRAALVAALGEPSDPGEASARNAGFDPSRSVMIYLVIAALLLLEWASRRLRGVK